MAWGLGRADLLDGLAIATKCTGDVADALAAATEAVALRRDAGDVWALAASLTTLSDSQWNTGDSIGAETTQQEVVALLEPHGESAPLALAYADLALTHMVASRLEPTMEACERALGMAQRTGADDALAAALNARGSIRIINGDPDGIDDLERCIEIARGAGLTSMVRRALANIGGGSADVRNYDAAEPALRAAIADAAATDDDVSLWCCSSSLAKVHLERGEWREAEDLLAGLPHGNAQKPLAQLFGLIVSGQLAARRGQPEAGAALERAWELAVGTQELQNMWPAAAALAQHAWLRGETDAIPALVSDTYAMATASGHALGDRGTRAVAAAGERPARGPSRVRRAVRAASAG